MLQYKDKHSRVLLKEFIKTDFKLRYQGSLLGYVWSLLKPMSLFLVLYVVFTQIVRFEGIEDYPLYLLVGIVVWTFFAEITTGSVSSVAGKGNLMRKINFPKRVVVVSGAISALINLMLNSLIVIIFMAILGVTPTPWIALLPLLVVQLYLFSIGLAFFLSTMYLKFKDVRYVWEVALQAGFYLTPVIYPLSIALDKSEGLAKAIMLSPLAQITQDIRYMLLGSNADTIQSVYGTLYIRVVPVVVTLVIFYVGGIYFDRKSPRFAENA